MTTAKITDCLGRTRSPDRVWPDGSYNCPFCSYAVAKDTACGNPACFARGGELGPYPASVAREVLADLEKQAEEKNRQEDLERWRKDYAAQRAAEETAWREQQIAEARRRGACLRCLFQAGHRRVKFIRHKTACPKG